MRIPAGPAGPSTPCRAVGDPCGAGTAAAARPPGMKLPAAAVRAARRSQITRMPPSWLPAFRFRFSGRPGQSTGIAARSMGPLAPEAEPAPSAPRSRTLPKGNGRDRTAAPARSPRGAPGLRTEAATRRARRGVASTPSRPAIALGSPFRRPGPARISTYDGREPRDPSPPPPPEDGGDMGQPGSGVQDRIMAPPTTGDLALLAAGLPAGRAVAFSGLSVSPGQHAGRFRQFLRQGHRAAAWRRRPGADRGTGLTQLRNNAAVERESGTTCVATLRQWRRPTGIPDLRACRTAGFLDRCGRSPVARTAGGHGPNHTRGSASPAAGRTACTFRPMEIGWRRSSLPGGRTAASGRENDPVADHATRTGQAGDRRRRERPAPAAGGRSPG